MQKLEDVAVEAAHISIREEVTFPASCLCLPGHSAALHAMCGSKLHRWLPACYGLCMIGALGLSVSMSKHICFSHPWSATIKPKACLYLSVHAIS